MSIQSVGYIIQDKQGNAIYGVGETVDAAWAQVVSEAGPFFNAYGDEKTADEAFVDDFKVYGATDGLIKHVNNFGGDISWDIIGGVACTHDEAEEA